MGEGLTGRGMEHPPPLSRRVTEDVFPCEQSINPHRPALLPESIRLRSAVCAAISASTEYVATVGTGINQSSVSFSMHSNTSRASVAPGV